MHGLGAQERRVGETRLFVVPNPSPANAHFRPEDQTDWYDRLADFLVACDQTVPAHRGCPSNRD